MAYELLCSVVAAGAQPTECAAWIQAWGSIGAILVAVLVAWWQFHATRKMARQTRKEKAMVMVEATEALLQMFASEAAATSALLDTASVGSLELYVSANDPALVFTTVERSMQTLPLHDLPDAKTVNLVVAAQHQIRTAREVFVRIARDHRLLGNVGIPVAANAFKRHATMAFELAEEAAEAKVRVGKSK